ncbi:MAG: hypothetical protein ABMB14_15295, partial [Myxococcota bacterium]
GTIQPPTGDDDDDDTVPTTPVNGDEASVVVLSLPPSVDAPFAQTVVLGMFAENRRGYLNLAQCVGAADPFCATALPLAPGDSVLVEPLDPTLVDHLDTVEVGAKITLGDWRADYQFDSATDLGFYYGAETNADLPGGSVGLSVGGDWLAYDGTDDIDVPSPIEVTAPDPTAAFEIPDTVPLRLAWTPGDQGDIYLLVTSPVENRLYLLDDDGEHDLDLGPLGLSEGDLVEIVLGRWSVTDLAIGADVVNIQIQSNQKLHGTWRKTGPRTELTDLYDDCAAAIDAPSAVPGNYTGDLQGMTKDLNPGNQGCTGFAATGIDGVVPIDLLTEDLLTVRYQLVDDDASLYLLTDCSDVGTCLDGADEGLKGDVEEVSFFNDTGAPQRVYAILDAAGDVTNKFNLDIVVDSLGGDVLVDTCVDAIAQGPVVSGSYHGSIAGNADLLDPACAEGAAGGEGMIQVYLEPGQTVTATATGFGSDPKVYLLYNCAIGDSCFLAVDDDAGATETLEYVNNTGFSEYFYLVVDGATNLGDYYLDLAIQ